MKQKKVFFFLKIKISNQFSVKGADLAKSVTELRNINGPEHLDFIIYTFQVSVFMTMRKE